MEVNTILAEIERLPLTERFLVMERTLTSIKNHELTHQIDHEIDDDSAPAFPAVSVNEISLAKDWLSEEDNRWDSVL